MEQGSHKRLGLLLNCTSKAQDWHKQVTENKFNSYLSGGHGYFCPASWFEQGWRCGYAEYEGRREGNQWRREERQQRLVHGLQQLATTLRKIEEKRQLGIKDETKSWQNNKSPSYQKGLQAEDGQPEQLTCPGNLGLQTQACLLQENRWLRRLGGWQEGRHLTMWNQWRAALLWLQTDGLKTATLFRSCLFSNPWYNQSLLSYWYF